MCFCLLSSKFRIQNYISMRSLGYVQGEPPPLFLFGGQSPQAAPRPCSPTIMAFADSIFSTLGILHCDVIGYFTESSKKTFYSRTVVQESTEIQLQLTYKIVNITMKWYRSVSVFLVFCFVLKFMLVAVSQESDLRGRP